MLDPRIYRASLIAVALAVFVLAFSLTDQQGAVGTNLAPEAFNAENAYATMNSLARNYPDRRPGSSDDYDVATYVARTLKHQTGSPCPRARTGSNTVDGKRTIETVMGTRAGLRSGTIVVVSHRDSLGSPSVADLSGTAVLLELARVLSGETQHRTIMLVSTSGSTGQAGAAQLAKTLPGPIDAVIALGDLAGRRIHEPVVVPWSNGPLVAPTMLRNTVAAALGSQAVLRPGGTSMAGQFAHLALPLTLTEQGPFGAAGQPAVLLSLAGEKSPAPDEPVSEAQDRAARPDRAEHRLRARHGTVRFRAVGLPALRRQGDPAVGDPPDGAGADPPRPAHDGRRGGPGAPPWPFDPALAGVGARRSAAVPARARPDLREPS